MKTKMSGAPYVHCRVLCFVCPAGLACRYKPICISFGNRRSAHVRRPHKNQKQTVPLHHKTFIFWSPPPPSCKSSIFCAFHLLLAGRLSCLFPLLFLTHFFTELCSQFHSPLREDKVDYDIVLSYRYDRPVVNFIPPARDYELGLRCTIMYS
jgi:hypothetical protein